MKIYSLTAQVETSDDVENMDGDEDEDDAHGMHYLQYGKERVMVSSPDSEVRFILKRMRECARILECWNARSLVRQVRIHIYLIHFYSWQD